MKTHSKLSSTRWWSFYWGQGVIIMIWDYEVNKQLNDFLQLPILLTFGIYFKQHFDTRYLVFYNPSPPRMFLSLDLNSEYRIQHGAIGPLYVTSSYSTWIFSRGVSGFATDCPCDVWYRGLTTCLLHVGPPFGNRFLNTSWAVGLTYWLEYLQFFYFDICNYLCLDASYHFWFYLYFLNILYFFKYSCTNIFHTHSLCTFYRISQHNFSPQTHFIYVRSL